ncbi:MAG: UDP-N-acetylmuramate dehydrogenase [Candidatus Omnitrophica bacterium]|nr:UDP-N-acetylmuramate dehydrogenase [Candidatus Omnitrophota bacterium]
MLNTKLESILLKEFGKDILKDFPMAQYTSFKCGGKAKYLIFPRNIEEVIKIFEIIENFNEDFLILGKGTNVLISDDGFNGIVISTLKMKNFILKGEEIECECGLKISELLKICIENSLSGIEFLSGIPGTIGGAIRNNAGLKEKWISERINYVESLNIKTLKIIKRRREEIFFDYRKSDFKKDEFILKTELFLQKEKKDKIKEMIKKYLKERVEKQPLGYSAGSIFKNPYPFYAGELIEKCGLKGYSIGDCFISSKHANFIINKGRGRAKDVYELIKLIKEKVKEKFNIELETEIELIGDFK